MRVRAGDDLQCLVRDDLICLSTPQTIAWSLLVPGCSIIPQDDRAILALVFPPEFMTSTHAEKHWRSASGSAPP